MNYYKRKKKEPTVPRVLFILKRREDYSVDLQNFTQKTVSTGMQNSAKFVSDMLNKTGIESKVVVVVDNNCIDREVTEFKPTHAIIEGLWVVPEKFDVLIPLHPKVKQIIRCHSEIPFLSQEGIAMKWMLEYLTKNVAVSCNAPRVHQEIKQLARCKLKIYGDKLEQLVPILYNYYPIIEEYDVRYGKKLPKEFHVGCFGAVRPMKNHLMQAVSAIEFADRNDLKLYFHINTGRIESNGGNSIKNVRALFEHLPDHQLVEHAQMDHDSFIDLIKEMHMCLQVSFTETFNIVTADAVANSVPVVVSNEMMQVSPPYADPTNSEDIIKTMSFVWKNKDWLIKRNIVNLNKYSDNSERIWLNYLYGYSLESNQGIEWLFNTVFNWFRQ